MCDRYLAIIHPLRPRFGSRRVLAVITAIWVCAAALASPNILFAETTPVYNSTRVICLLEWPSGPYADEDTTYVYTHYTGAPDFSGNGYFVSCCSL